jgi:hypothetical protein
MLTGPLNNPGSIDVMTLKKPGGGSNRPYMNKTGRTLVHPAIIAGEDTGVFVTIGQSNGAGANYVNAAYTPTNAAKNQALNIYDGGVYRAADPVLGADGTVGSWGGRLADKLIDAGIFDRVVLVPTEVGGTAIAEWQPGADYFDRIIIATRRAVAAGLPVTGYLWAQGENGAQSGYAAALSAIISGVRAFGSGFQAPWFIGICTYNAGSENSTIQAEQASVVNGIDIFAGGNTDTLTGGTNRAGDNTHLTATGADAAAALWKTAIDAVF